ncbi:TPA: hypothetical protein ACGRP4_001299 [Stenotrophomonas maltophilia]|jgi:hypothetical protein|nr:hypothetical protein [Stenotrophomonas maltophilia]
MDETVYDAAWRAYKAAPRARANGPSRSAVRAAVDAALAVRRLFDQQSVLMLPDDARLTRLIADNIERGKLDHPGFYRNSQLAEVLRRVLSAALARQTVDLGSGIEAIAGERQRQLQAEGFTREKDQQYRRGELAKAATAYVQLAALDLEAGTRNHIAWHGPAAVWPWAAEWWKPVDARRDLVRAGALIAAQIDQIDSQEGAADAP